MPLRRIFVATLLALFAGSGPVVSGEVRMEPQLSQKDSAKAAALIRKALKKRGFDDDAIAAIVESGEGYEPTFGFNISDNFKSRWFGFDPETGKQYPSDVFGFATSLNACYSKRSPNKYSRKYNLDRYKADYPEGNERGPNASDETFGYCNYRFDPATGCRLSELQGFRCRYFVHNEGGTGTCDNWGAGPLLAFDPGDQGYAKLQLEAPKRQEVELSKVKKRPKKKQKKVATCDFVIDNAQELQKYLSEAKANGYPN